VSGSPVTTSGTLALAFTTGYGIPPLMTGNSGRFLTTNGTTMSWVNIAGTDVTGAALTEVDDTNVTCTLGGTHATSLLRAVSLTFGWAGTLAVSRGGSGASTLTGVLIGNGTSAFTGVAGTASQLLRRNAGNTAYEFFSGGNLTSSNDTNIQITLGGTPTGSLINAVSLTMGWTGQLAVGRGGTGAATLTGVVIGNATANMTAVAGTAGQFLRRNTANTAYEFRTLQGGDIAGSELTFSNDTNVQMTLGGTPASALLQPVSINLGWTGQLAVSRGGTGASTLTGVLIGNGTSAVTAITGTANQILRRNSGNTAYEFWSANYLVNPMTLEGSIIYAATGGTPTELFANNTSTSKYLRSVNGTAPTWEALPASVGGSGTTNYVAKWTPSGTVLGNSQIYDNGTNIGIGDASPSVLIDAYKASNGIIRVRADNGGAFYVANSTKTGTIAAFGDAGGIIGGAADTTAMIYSGGVPLAFYVNSFERARITTSGLFGIGTNAPSTKFHVVGTGEIVRVEGTGTGNNYIGFRNGTTNLGYIGYGSAGNNGLTLGNYQNDDINLVTNSTIRVTVTGSGNVGIGNNTPTHKLEVIGVISAGTDSATNGSIILQDNYSLGHLANLCTNRSVGNPVLTYGLITSTSTSNAFVSSTSIDIPRGALSVAGDLTFSSAASAIVSIGSSVTMTQRFTITNGGQMVLPMYTSSSSMPGTAAGVLAFNSIGSIITIAAPSAASSGTYTPTWTGLTNVDSITAYSCQYLRVGDTVTVSGYVGINATVDNTPTTAQLTVPVNSSLSTINYCCGVGVQDNGGATGSILGLGSNTAQFEFSPLVDTMVYYSFHFTYRIV
jgi:hypothetical protein